MRNFTTVKLFLIASIILLMGACTPKKSDVPADALQLDKPSLIWGGVAPDTEGFVQEITVKNNSDAEIDDLKRKLDKKQTSIFLIGSDCSKKLAPRAECKVSVKFKPDQKDKFYKDKYIFTYKATTGTASSSVVLSGDSYFGDGVVTDVGELRIAGVEPEGDNSHFVVKNIFKSSPGVTSDDASIVLNWKGTKSLKISITPTDPNKPEGFAISANTCVSGLINNQSCNISFNFTPELDGDKEALFTLSTTAEGDDAPKVLSVKTKGTSTITRSPDLTLTVEGTENFGSKNVGELSDPKTVTLKNNTDKKVFYRTLATSGAFNIAFGASGRACNGVIGANEECELEARFAPTLKGENSAYLRVLSGSRVAYAKVNGSGTDAATGNVISTSAPKLNFPETEEKFPSLPKTTTFTALTADNYTVSIAFDANSAGKSQLFRYTSTCSSVPLHKDNNKSCAVTVTYSPSAPTSAADTATLVATFKKVFDNTTTTQDIVLSGTARAKSSDSLETPIPNLTVSQRNFVFPDTAIGLNSLFTLKVKNNGTTDVTGFGSTSTDLITFPLAEDFTTCTSVIPADGECNVAYHFVARAPATKTAFISLNADGVETDNQIIEVSGKGTLFNKYLNFGYVNDAPKVLSMAYVNDTNITQDIDAIEIKNIYTKWDTTDTTVDVFTKEKITEVPIDDKKPFTLLSDDCKGRPISAQESCIIRIQFNPNESVTANTEGAYRARILLKNGGKVLTNADGKLVGQLHATASTKNDTIMYFPTDSETTGTPVFVGPKASPTEAASQAQIDAVTAVIGEKFYVYGGLSDYSSLNQAYTWTKDTNVQKLRVYDAARNMWRVLNPSGASPIVAAPGKDAHASATASVVNSKLYIFGGTLKRNTSASDDKPTNDVFVYDPTDVSASLDGSWSKLATIGTTPKLKQGAPSASLSGHLFVFGGINGPELFNEFHALDLRGDRPTWITIPVPADPTKGPKPRSNAAMVAYDNKIYIHGGNDDIKQDAVTQVPKEANDLWEYTPVFNEKTGNLTLSGTWKRIYEGDSAQIAQGEQDDKRPSTRIKHTMSVVDGKLIIAGQGFIWPDTAVTNFKKNYFQVMPEGAGDVLDFDKIFKQLKVENLDKLGREATGMVAGHYSAAIEGVFWFYNVNIMGLLMDQR